MPGAIGVDSTFSGFLATKFAETSPPARISRRRVVRGSKTVAECALPLRSPHDSINVIGAREVFNQPRKEVPVIRVVDAESFLMPPVQVSLLHLIDIGKVFAEYIFHPTRSEERRVGKECRSRLYTEF